MVFLERSRHVRWDLASHWELWRDEEMHEDGPHELVERMGFGEVHEKREALRGFIG